MHFKLLSMRLRSIDLFNLQWHCKFQSLNININSCSLGQRIQFKSNETNNNTDKVDIFAKKEDLSLCYMQLILCTTGSNNGWGKLILKKKYVMVLTCLTSVNCSRLPKTNKYYYLQSYIGYVLDITKCEWLLCCYLGSRLLTVGCEPSNTMIKSVNCQQLYDSWV